MSNVIEFPLPDRNIRTVLHINVRLVPAAASALDASMKRDGDIRTDVINRALIFYQTLIQEMHDQQVTDITIGKKTFRPEGVLEK